MLPVKVPSNLIRFYKIGIFYVVLIENLKLNIYRNKVSYAKIIY